MANDESIERHYAALRQVMADPDMNPRGPYATISQEQYFDNSGARPRSTSERRALHRQWIQEVIDDAAKRGEIKHEGKAIVMAGPPGAGKGTVQRERLNDVPGYVQCDPDMFKEKIIQHELDSGNLDRLKTPLVKELEAQGYEFPAPAGMIHQETDSPTTRAQVPRACGDSLDQTTSQRRLAWPHRIATTYPRLSLHVVSPKRSTAANWKA